MGVTLVSGDLLKTDDVDAVVNAVNCVGVMGKGLALQTKHRWPDNFLAYAAACKRGDVRIGQVFVHDMGGPEKPRFILNFPTKDHWRTPSRIAFIRLGLVDLAQQVRRLGITSIALPALGCGNGGLDWKAVRPLIESTFADLPDVEARLFRPAVEAPVSIYTGIGSRATPPEILLLMRRIGAALAKAGWVLRSGAADGADGAFEAGAASVGGSMEIYLPWRGFGCSESGIDASALPSFNQARQMAARNHPAWDRLRPAVRSLMARNAMQVLGASLDTRSRFVVCWAEGSVFRGDTLVNVAGGTGLAVRLAVEQGIPVFNLAVDAHHRRIMAWLKVA